jgi:hypothetical protein
MKTPNEKKEDKRTSSMLSAVDRQANEPDRQFLDELQARSTVEFLAHSADSVKASGKITIPISIWRTIMRSRITKFATAAVIIIGTPLVIKHIGGSFDGTSTAFADMIQAMKKKSWVHASTTATESGEITFERWYGLESGISASKNYREATLLYVNTQENSEYVYKEEGVILYSQIDDSVRPSGDVPDSPFALVESMMKYINEYASEVTREIVVRDNREVELITATGSKNEESIFHTIELTRDIQDNLLLSVKTDYKDRPEYILSQEPKEVAEGWRKARTDVVTKYDYPATGPSSIYDLGVPKDTRIVVSSLPSEIQEIIEKLNSLRQTTLTRYVLIAILDDVDMLPTSPNGLRSAAFFSKNDRSVYSTWRRGDVLRFSQGYFPVLEKVPDREELSANTEFWVEQIEPVREFINIPEGDYHYHNYHWENVGINILAESKHNTAHLYESDSHLIEKCWPKIKVPHRQAMKWSIEHLDGRGGDELIMITRRMDATTAKWHINPDKNYICQKYELFRADGTPARCKEILEYATTKSGQFYPRKIRHTRYKQQDKQLVQEATTELIYLKENPEYPDQIFDPDSFPESDQ